VKSDTVAGGRIVPARSRFVGSQPTAQNKVSFGLAFFYAWRCPTPKGPFISSDFVPTRHSTAADKADFGNVSMSFIESKWKRELFKKRPHHRLSMCFGHIAH
jgi:hypothetical protein